MSEAMDDWDRRKYQLLGRLNRIVREATRLILNLECTDEEDFAMKTTIIRDLLDEAEVANMAVINHSLTR